MQWIICGGLAALAAVALGACNSAKEPRPGGDDHGAIALRDLDPDLRREIGLDVDPDLDPSLRREIGLDTDVDLDPQLRREIGLDPVPELGSDLRRELGLDPEPPRASVLSVTDERRSARF